MRTFYIHPLAAAIILSVLSMGLIGVLVVLPVLVINWAWNVTVAQYTVLPEIGIWQSALLYFALGSLVYLSGAVKIEFNAESVD